MKITPRNVNVHSLLFKKLNPMIEKIDCDKGVTEK